MPRTNKSHVVPQFYLRYFSNNPNAKPKKRRINVLQKQEAKILDNKLISDIGHIRRFYTLENDTDDTYEKKLAELEGKASVEYNKLVKSRDFTRCNPVTFLRFFALQAIRTGRTRKDLLKQIKDAVINANTTIQNKELLELAYPLVVTHKLNQIEILFNQEPNKLRLLKF